MGGVGSKPLEEALRDHLQGDYVIHDRSPASQESRKEYDNVLGAKDHATDKSATNHVLFSLYPGRHVPTGDFISVFLAPMNESSPLYAKDRAQNALKMLRTIRHPGLIKYRDSFTEHGFIGIITGGVIKLNDLIGSLPLEEVVLGMYNITETIAFLHSKNLCVRNLRLDSIYVSVSDRTWKLGELELMDYDEAKSPNNGRSPNQIHDILCLAEIFKSIQKLRGGTVDSPICQWSLFNTLLAGLAQSDTTRIPAAFKIIEDKFFNTNPLIIVLERVLKVIRTMPAGEKPYIFSDLASLVETLPTSTFIAYVLPHILSRELFREPGVEFLFRKIFLGKNSANHALKVKMPTLVPEPTYKQYVVPFICQMFSVKEYDVRMILLKLFDGFFRDLVDWNFSQVLSNVMPELLFGLSEDDSEIRRLSFSCLCFAAPCLLERCNQLQQDTPRTQGSTESSVERLSYMLEDILERGILDEIMTACVVQGYKKESRDFILCHSLKLWKVLTSPHISIKTRKQFLKKLEHVFFIICDILTCVELMVFLQVILNQETSTEKEELRAFCSRAIKIFSPLLCHGDSKLRQTTQETLTFLLNTASRIVEPQSSAAVTTDNVEVDQSRRKQLERVYGEAITYQARLAKTGPNLQHRPLAERPMQRAPTIEINMMPMATDDLVDSAIVTSPTAKKQTSNQSFEEVSLSVPSQEQVTPNPTQTLTEKPLPSISMSESTVAKIGQSIAFWEEDGIFSPPTASKTNSKDALADDSNIPVSVTRILQKSSSSTNPVAEVEKSSVPVPIAWLQ